MIKWISRVGNISMEHVGTNTMQSKAFDMGISALIASVASLATNMFERLATTVEETNVDGTKYSAYGLV